MGPNKPGPLSARIPFKDLVRAARDYAFPQISIVSPRLVICLGLNTFRAIQQATGGGAAENLEAAISGPFEFGKSTVWCQAHPGGLGQAGRNRGKPDRVNQDWDAMRQAIGRGEVTNLADRSWQSRRPPTPVEQTWRSRHDSRDNEVGTRRCWR